MNNPLVIWRQRDGSPWHHRWRYHGNGDDDDDDDDDDDGGDDDDVVV